VQRQISPDTHFLPQFCGIGGIDQARNIHAYEIRVAEIARPVAVGETHRLDDGLIAPRLVYRVQIEPLQDIQHLQQDNATRGRQRRRSDANVTIDPTHRLALDHAVVSQILHAPDAASGTYTVYQTFSDTPR
jgi:hypothetical protein